MPKINPQILKWARETAGLSIEEAAKKLGLSDTQATTAVEKLELLETGDKKPTRSQLLKMAKQYRRSLVTFYLASPPARGDRGEDFRSLPGDAGATDGALVDAAIRDIRVRQQLVKSALSEDEIETVKFVGTLDISIPVSRAALAVTDTIEFSREAYVGLADDQSRFAYLRALVEATGTFVLLLDNLGSHHTTIPLKLFRGFALADNVAPFVAVNANDSRKAWSFTLLHEFVHLMLGETGVSAGFSELKIEQFCNDVASEILLPQSAISQVFLPEEVDTEEALIAIRDVSEKFNVSMTLVAYRLYRGGHISGAAFQELSEKFKGLFQESQNALKSERRGRRGGPSYYVVRQHRLGRALINSVRELMFTGALSTAKAGRVLGVKPQNVQSVLDSVRNNGLTEMA